MARRGVDPIGLLLLIGVGGYFALRGTRGLAAALQLPASLTPTPYPLDIDWGDGRPGETGPDGRPASVIEPRPIVPPAGHNPRPVNASAPRGIRNNNPGNIEATADNWLGKVGDDGRFVKFSAPVYGFRAMFIILRRYIQTHKLNTIAKIAGRWAPAGENDSGQWARNVAAFSGIPINAPLVFPTSTANMGQMIALGRGITGTENGAAWANQYDTGTIGGGVAMAITQGG